MSKRSRSTAEMPFLDHLEELRWRLIKSIAAVLIGALLGFWIVTHFNVLELLIDPIRPLLNDQKLKYLSPGDPFFVTLGLALTVGLLLAFPVVAAQFWNFISPALLPREKRALVPALYLGLVLFCAGIAMAYYIVLPMTLRFFMSFQSGTLEQSIVIGPYIGLVVKILLAFGLLFELPVVVLVLSALGLVTSRFLSQKRRYAIAGMAFIAAFVTPGDAVTLTVFMMGPLILLYELSILLAKLMERRRAKSLKAAAAIVVAVLLSAPTARAQQPTHARPDTLKPKTTREVVLGRLRTLNQSEIRDTLARDTTPRAARPREPRSRPVEFASDSVMRALMALEGFQATQYRGTGALFVADSNQLVLYGKPDVKAGVSREGQILTADSLVTFDESSAVACGFGKPELSGGSTDAPITSREICYDTRNKIGMAVGARTQITEGANWIVTGDLYYKGGNAYGHDGKFTDCSLEVPHYHFAAGKVKIVNNDVMVARNVTLNFGDVPVFWLPFFMQSMKKGRRSGVLMPDFSINDIVRRNQNYNRRISNIGFYWAVSENIGSELSLDWWSNNYTAVQLAFDYNYINKFISGNAMVKRFWEAGGSKQFSIVSGHNWQPDERTQVNVQAEYITSTTLIQQRSFDPRDLRRRISSTASLSRRFGWGSVSLQSTRNQDITDKTVDLVLPSVGVNFSTVTLFPAAGQTRWFNNATWTSSAQLRRTKTDFGSSNFDRSGINGSASSSFNIGRLSWSQSFDANQQRGAVGRRNGDRVDSLYSSVQKMAWRTSLNFQQRLIGTSTFTPGISITQDLERGDTIPGNRLLRAPLRIDANAAVKMDLFGFWPGVGPLERFRHRLSPTVQYTYSPAASINPLDSLRIAVFGGTRAQERNTVSIGLSQTIEGKYKEDARNAADSAAIDSTTVDPTRPRRLPQARKVTVLSLATDAVIYDFVAGRRDGHGIQTTQISNTINSDLLRGLQLTLSHELFQPTDSATAAATGSDRRFAPRLSRVSASFSLSNNSFLFRMFGLGKKSDAPPATGSQETPAPENLEGGPRPTDAQRPDQSIMGNRATQTTPPSRGPVGSWNASFNVTIDRPRPNALPGLATSGNGMVTANLSFQPTQMWNVQWNTGYSFSDGRFADHILTFTRQMHDWDANFNFMKSANGNFSFAFNVRLRANPDIKFDYTQRSNIRTPARQ